MTRKKKRTTLSRNVLLVCIWLDHIQWHISCVHFFYITTKLFIIWLCLSAIGLQLYFSLFSFSVNIFFSLGFLLNRRVCCDYHRLWRYKSFIPAQRVLQMCNYHAFKFYNARDVHVQWQLACDLSRGFFVCLCHAKQRKRAKRMYADLGLPLVLLVPLQLYHFVLQILSAVQIQSYRSYWRWKTNVCLWW